MWWISSHPHLVTDTHLLCILNWDHFSLSTVTVFICIPRAPFFILNQYEKDWTVGLSSVTGLSHTLAEAEIGSSLQARQILRVNTCVRLVRHNRYLFWRCAEKPLSVCTSSFQYSIYFIEVLSVTICVKKHKLCKSGQQTAEASSFITTLV